MLPESGDQARPKTDTLVVVQDFDLVGGRCTCVRCVVLWYVLILHPILEEWASSLGEGLEISASGEGTPFVRLVTVSIIEPTILIVRISGSFL